MAATQARASNYGTVCCLGYCAVSETYIDVEKIYLEGDNGRGRTHRVMLQSGNVVSEHLTQLPQSNNWVVKAS